VNAGTVSSNTASSNSAWNRHFGLEWVPTVHCDGQLHNPNTGGNGGLLLGETPGETFYNVLQRTLAPVFRLGDAIRQSTTVQAETGIGIQIPVKGFNPGASYTTSRSVNLGDGSVRNEVVYTVEVPPFSIRIAICNDTGETSRSISVGPFGVTCNSDFVVSVDLRKYAGGGGGIGGQFNFGELGRQLGR